MSYVPGTNKVDELVATRTSETGNELGTTGTSGEEGRVEGSL
jgi:hypothetical protein